MAQRIDVPGMGVVEFPDGMTDDQIAAAIRRSMGQPEKPSLPPIVERFRDLAAGGIRGAASIGATLMRPNDILEELLFKAKGVDKPSPDRRKAVDEVLAAQGADTNSAMYGAGKIGAEVAGTLGVGGALGGLLGKALPAAAAPFVDAVSTAGFKAGGVQGLPGLGLRVAGGAVTGGASAGLVNPADAGMGAAIGGALPIAAKTMNAAGQLAGKVMRPDASKAELASKAVNQYGIPLGLSDVTDNAMLKGARSALDDVPVIGRIGASRKDAIQSAFNREVGKTFGETVDSLTPQVMDGAKGRIGAALDAAWNRNALQIDGPLVQSLQDIQQQAMQKLNPGQAAQIDRTIQGLLQKAQNGQIEGAFANNWQSELRMVADAEKGLHKKLLTDLRRSVLDAFKRSLPSDEAAGLSKAMAQYRAFKTVQPLMDKAAAGTAGRAAGDVPASLLPEAVRQSYGSSLASSPFSDLSQIGSQFVADRVARTGGSARAMFQNSALGTGLALGSWTNPLIPMLGLPAAAGVEGLLSSPAMARMLLGQPTRGLLNPQMLYRAAPALTADQ